MTKKGSLNGRIFDIDDYTLIFLFSQCIRCAQKRYCWESVRFASERSRVRIPLGPPICRIVFVRCGVFYAQKTLANRAGLRTLKSDANRAGSSMYFLKIHRFHASFFAFCRVLRASTSLLCPLLGNFFKNLRTIVGRYSLELLHLIEAGVQRNRDLIVFSDANLLNELLQNGAAFIVVGGVVNIRPCKGFICPGTLSHPA